MTREEVLKYPIWMSRLIFKASLHFGKKYKDLTEDEDYELRKIIIAETKEREERSAKFNSYGRF